MSARIDCCIAATVTLLGLVASSRSQVLNVNFTGSGGNTYAGQGALTDPGNSTWNNVTGASATYSDLVWSDNTPATGVSVVTANAAVYAAGSPSISLFRGYIYNQGAVSGSITIIGLTPGAEYDIYLYSGGNATTWATIFTVGGISSSALSTTNTSAFVNGVVDPINGNYVMFLNQTAVDGSLTIQVRGASTYWAVDGLQVALSPERENSPAPLNVNFMGNDKNAYAGQGALTDPGNSTWNNVSGVSATYSGLVWSDGTPAGGVSVVTSNALGYTFGSSGISLFQGYISKQGTSPGSITINGLIPGAKYDIYLYSGGNVTAWATVFTVGGIGSSTLSTTNTSTFVNGVVDPVNGNYVIFSSQTAVGGSLTINVQGPSTYWAVDGLQVALSPERKSSPAPLNINFTGSGGTYTGQGALTDPDNNTWNNVSGASATYSCLVWSDGTPAGGVSVVTSNAQGYSFGTSGISLFTGYISKQGTSPGSITINGLTPGANYDLYLYSGGNATAWATVFTVGGTSSSALSTTNTSTFVNAATDPINGNYVKFLKQTAVDGSLTINVQGPSTYWAVDGLQLALMSVQGTIMCVR
ncbi:MAG: hypothetical protein PHR35_19140 [Kiritimatiellae bacterium]|nr:hypothetical protein [Kiritimatiellia bacterium]